MPDVYVDATAYAVCCLPLSHRARRHYTITVKIRNPAEGLWAVCAYGCVFDIDGNLSYEASPLHRDDAWIARHRFPLDQALDLAKRMAPAMTANGHTVEHALAHPDWR